MVYRYTKAPSQRQLMVAEIIKEAISEIFIRNELSQPAFEKIFITVSEVRISPDLKIATAFVASISEVDKNELIGFLNGMASQIRLILRKKVDLRFTPEVRFAYDKSFDDGAKIEALLHETK
jgi:ribosome-binding factor A